MPHYSYSILDREGGLNGNAKCGRDSLQKMSFGDIFHSAPAQDVKWNSPRSAELEVLK